jgi:hypothetical protein
MNIRLNLNTQVTVRLTERGRAKMVGSRWQSTATLPPVGEPYTAPLWVLVNGLDASPSDMLELAGNAVEIAEADWLRAWDEAREDALCAPRRTDGSQIHLDGLVEVPPPSENMPLDCDAGVLAAYSAGFDLDRDCFVTGEEVPDAPLLTENGVTFRKGSVVISGPVSPKCGRYEASPVLHAKIMASRAALGADAFVAVRADVAAPTGVALPITSTNSCSVGNVHVVTTTDPDGVRQRITTETVKPGEPFRSEMERTLERERQMRVDARVAAAELLAMAVEGHVRYSEQEPELRGTTGPLEDALAAYRSVK